MVDEQQGKNNGVGEGAAYTAVPGITPEMIAMRAYARFEQRGCQHGHDVEDWLAAEAELAEQMTYSKKTVRARPPTRATTRAAKTSKKR